MINIGILTCSNSINESGCSGIGCYDAAYDRTGKLGEHGQEIRLKGVINCAGCPGKSGFDKILRRVRSLVASGAEAIHLGNCMELYCPFISKYEEAISKAFPELKVVRGVHPSPPAEILSVVENNKEIRGYDRPTSIEVIIAAYAAASEGVK
jgi:predicted metal-binding protein